MNNERGSVSMKWFRLSTILLLGLVFCFLHLDSVVLAEEKAADEKASEMVEATLRATCEGFPVKNLGVRLRLVNIQSGEEHKYKGRTDQNGVYSFSIPPGNYKCSSISMHGSSGLYKAGGPATTIVGPEGDKPFNLHNYFNASTFWRSGEKIRSLKSEDFALPDIEFIPRFEVVFPADGSTVKERLPVLRWKSVEGAKSYALRINEKTQLKGRSRGIKSVFRKDNIYSTEYRLDTPLLESGKEYSLHVEAIDSEGKTINRSKIITFTMAGEES